MTRRWEPYEADGSDFVPVERWGKDHWSTMAYLFTRCMDHAGVIDNRHMRTHPRVHRGLVGITLGKIQDGSAWPTRLRDGEAERHDDWSCLEDMVAAGVLTAQARVRYTSQMFGGSEARVRFTDVGKRVAQALLVHKVDGGQYAKFEMGLLPPAVQAELVTSRASCGAQP